MNLFLDDIRDPSGVANYIYPIELRSIYKLENWEIVRNYEQFVDFINKNGLPKKISFDHDLADIHYDIKTWTQGFKYHEKTGFDCAKFMIEYCLKNNLKFPEWYCHSQNPVGRNNIISLINNFKKYGES